MLDMTGLFRKIKFSQIEQLFLQKRYFRSHKMNSGKKSISIDRKNFTNSRTLTVKYL